MRNAITVAAGAGATVSALSLASNILGIIGAIISISATAGVLVARVRRRCSERKANHE